MTPPFSLFTDYIKQLMDYGKKFIIIGNTNAITYREIFPLIQNNELWLGYSPRGLDFILPNGGTSNVNAVWFTNVEHKKRNTPLDLYKRYSNEYPKYDNYDAIEVGKTCDIPMDYDGVMGVPITFLDKYCPEQFEILWQASGNSYANAPKELMEELKFDPTVKYGGGLGTCVLNGKAVYTRILIRKRTAPPFSLFREYVKQLMDYGKKFIIIGNQNAIGWKEIFPYIKEDKLWLGVTMNGANRWFYAPDTYEVNEKAAGYKVENGRKMFFVNGVVWYTNIENSKRNTPLDLYKRYSNEYPKYDNINAIEVSRVENIPMDYDGLMGVPLTFLHKYNPEQFEILDIINRYMIFDYFGVNEDVAKRHSHCCNVNGKSVYTRILIRKRTA